MIRSTIIPHTEPSEISMGLLGGIPANKGILDAIHSLRVPPVENNDMVNTTRRGSSSEHGSHVSDQNSEADLPPKSTLIRTVLTRRELRWFNTENLGKLEGYQ